MTTYSSISDFSIGASEPSSGGTGKSIDEVLMKVREKDVHTRAAERQIEMKRIKVRSNSLKSRTEAFGDRGAELVLKFDDKGVASFPPHQLPLMKKIMRLRPGRFVLLAQEELTDPLPQAEALEMLQKLKEAEEQDKAQAQAAKEADVLAAQAADAEAAQAQAEANKAAAQAEADQRASDAAEAARVDAEPPKPKSTKSKSQTNSGRKTKKEE
jgi:colicin import membrane protein